MGYQLDSDRHRTCLCEKQAEQNEDLHCCRTARGAAGDQDADECARQRDQSDRAGLVDTRQESVRGRGADDFQACLAIGETQAHRGFDFTETVVNGIQCAARRQGGRGHRAAEDDAADRHDRGPRERNHSAAEHQRKHGSPPGPQGCGQPYPRASRACPAGSGEHGGCEHHTQDQERGPQVAEGGGQHQCHQAQLYDRPNGRTGHDQCRTETRDPVHRR